MRTLIIGIVLFPLCAFAQEEPAEKWMAPDDITFRRANIMSEGTRMAAEVFVPKEAKEENLPTIVMCHGWGGIAEHLRPDAIAFAKAGYLVVTLDYRGWGNSDSRLILTRPAPVAQTSRWCSPLKSGRFARS